MQAELLWIVDHLVTVDAPMEVNTPSCSAASPKFVAAAVEKIEGKPEAKNEAAAVAAETEALIKRLQNCLAGLVCLVCSQLGRVTSVLTAATNTLTALPWTAWTLLISNIVSNFLWGAAW